MSKRSKKPVYDKLAIIGMGLIGSSIARAVKAHGLAGEMAFYDSDKAARETLKKLKLGGAVAATPREAVRDADCIIIATPVGAMEKIAKDIAPAIKPGAVVTDTGSTKTSVIADVKPHLPQHCFFLPSHPVAGTEFSGPQAGFAELFAGRYWIVIDGVGMKKGRDAARKKYESFLRGMGARVEIMNAKHHDEVMAITSHIPHLIAYAIVGTAFDFGTRTRREVIKYSASGFRDFTRIAASDPIMWRDVFLKNKSATLAMLKRFEKDLRYLRGAIEKSDGRKLKNRFTRTRDIRKKIRDLGQLD